MHKWNHQITGGQPPQSPHAEAIVCVLMLAVSFAIIALAQSHAWLVAGVIGAGVSLIWLGTMPSEPKP